MVKDAYEAERKALLQGEHLTPWERLSDASQLVCPSRTSRRVQTKK